MLKLMQKVLGSQFVFIYIIDKKKAAKIYLEDINLGELEKIKNYKKGCFVHSGRHKGQITSTIAISNDAIYCDGIKILSSDKKFQGIIDTLYKLKVNHNNGLIPYDPNCLGFATIFLYGNKDIQVTTQDAICIKCNSPLVNIKASDQKYVCTNCRRIYKKSDDKYHPTKKRMSEGSFDRLNK